MRYWKLQGPKFSQFTIIAGQNSSGKTRTCNVIRNTVKKIIDPMKPPLQLGKTDIAIDTSEDKSYKIIIYIEEEEDFNRAITKEELYEVRRNRKTMLFNRKTIYDARSKSRIRYSPPDESLTFHARRDKLSYPYLEDIVSAMRKFHFLDFEEPKAIAVISLAEIVLPIEILPSLTPACFQKMVDEDKKKEILNDINSLDFPIKNMFIKPRMIDGREVPFLYLEEKNVKGAYDFTQASSGMFKIIFLIVFLHLIEKGSCILIDNAADGLDYKRSMDILRIVEREAEHKQIILCTNNEILLNQTDIRNWNILYRLGSTVKAYNYTNSKERLSKFSDTGLSNYEYFRDEYFLTK